MRANDTTGKEKRRREAIRLRLQGVGTVEVAQRLGVSREAVRLWCVRHAERGGATPPPRRRPRKEVHVPPGKPWQEHAAGRAQRRQEAIRLLRQGVGTVEVAECLGVSREAVRLWAVQYAELGRAALRPGRPPKTPRVSLSAIERLLRQGAHAHGFETGGWTLSRVAQAIERMSGVRYSRPYVWNLLRHKLKYEQKGGSWVPSTNRTRSSAKSPGATAGC